MLEHDVHGTTPQGRAADVVILFIRELIIPRSKTIEVPWTNLCQILLTTLARTKQTARKSPHEPALGMPFHFLVYFVS